MQPMQEIYRGRDGVIRFKPNKIIQWLFDNGHLDMNKIQTIDFIDEDRVQLVQQLGYSVSGFGNLSYVPEELASWCDYLADRLPL